MRASPGQRTPYGSAVSCGARIPPRTNSGRTNRRPPCRAPLRNSGSGSFHSANTGRGICKADHVLVAAIGKQLAVNLLGAANGLIVAGSLSRRAMRRALESHTDFISLACLLKSRVSQNGDERDRSQRDDPSHICGFLHHSNLADLWDPTAARGVVRVIEPSRHFLQQLLFQMRREPFEFGYLL